MKRKCSVCKEKGHDKRQCPVVKKQKAEAKKVLNDRLTALLEATPKLIENPYLMGLVWYRLSKDNVMLSRANYLILAGDVVGLNVPSGATLGALLQKSTGALDVLPQVKKDLISKLKKETVTDPRREIREHAWKTRQQFDDLIEQIKFIFAEEYREPQTEQEYSDTIESTEDTVYIPHQY